MDINTSWHNPADAPTFGMPNDGSLSCAAPARPCAAPAGIYAGHVAGSVTGSATGSATGNVNDRIVTSVAAVRIDGVRVTDLFPGSRAWSPPNS